ncbi:MAG TPA: hypothetical protein VJO99_15275 [Burkholderiaceae bacterium]|nr:hypothetical protein [Burkholderiaceae bacterium]
MNWVLRSLLVSLAVSALLIGTAMIGGTPFDHAVLTIDDAQFTLNDLSAGHWLLALAGVAIACVVVMLVVPLAVLLPLAVAAIAVTAALVLTTAVLGVVFSPVILIVWLIWRAARHDSPRTAPPSAPAPPANPAAPATIAG